MSYKSYRFFDVVAEQFDSESFDSLEEAQAARGSSRHLEVHLQDHTDRCRYGGGDVAGACTSVVVVRAAGVAYQRARALGRELL